MSMIFDSHAHYDDAKFDEDREKVLSLLPKNGVCAVLNAGTNIETSKKAISLAEKYSYIYAAVGIHPECVLETKDEDLMRLKELAKLKKVIAIGEIGLDYHYSIENKDLQLKFFEKQLSIANETSLPVLIHDREAHMDTINLIKKYKPKGVIHCFSGSLEMAKEVLGMGMLLGIGGVVTFKNAKKLIEIVKEIPLEAILLETDAPYMAPTPFRGKRCDSTYIKFTAQKIAEIKNKPYEEVLDITKDNALNLFNLENVL